MSRGNTNNYTNSNNICNYFFKWDKNYNKSFLRFDAITGITVGAIAIPEAITYSSLAGLSPETGLYSAIVALLV